MKHPKIQSLLAIAAFTPIAVPAHHSSAPHFDSSMEVVVEGVVTEWRFVNPHAYVYFDVVNDSGETVAWRCESSDVMNLSATPYEPYNCTDLSGKNNMRPEQPGSTGIISR